MVKRRNQIKDPIIRVADCAMLGNLHMSRKTLPGGGLFVYRKPWPKPCTVNLINDSADELKIWTIKIKRQKRSFIKLGGFGC
jgi:hypothetical protein